MFFCYKIAKNVLNLNKFSRKSCMKSNLITRGGHDKLVAELKHLWHTERPEITKKVNWAASLGDRSENADRKI
jgi:hypothetical protein